MSSSVMAQSDAYYYGWNGDIVELTELPGQMAVKFIGESEQDVVQSLSHTYQIRHADHIKHRDTGDMYRLVYDEHITTNELNTELQANDRIVVPIYNGGNQVLIPTPIFSLYMPDLSMIERMEQLNKEFGVEVVHEYKSVPGMFSLRITDWVENDVFTLSRRYYESLNANWSAPSFFRDWERFGSVEDPYFQYQYYMHQIDAELAWHISTGDDDVIVAVIDDGVMAHEDLPSLRIVAGFDYGSNNGAPEGNEAHGMAVSGIIAASHNNLGIAGLAPETKIMPIRIFRDNGEAFVTDGDISAGIDFAILNGVSIFNGSFGADPNGDNFVEAPNVNQIIDAHKNSHLFVFASGNNGGVVHYPAYLDGVVAVGAVNQSDNVQSYSSTGNELNLVAPAGGLSTETSTDQCLGVLDEYSTSTLEGNVWTLDQDGADGVNPGDTGTENNCRNTYNWTMPQGLPTPDNGYTAHFGGTSAAAPQAAGVAALMLSINSSLTISQIQSILQNTADQVSGMGGLSFTNEYGHGRLNAYKSVKEAMPNQYAGQSFTSSTTLPEFSRVKGSTSVSSGVTLTIASGEVTVIEGSMSGTNSSLAVNGRLIIEESANISNVNIDVGANGMVIIREGASISNGAIDVASSGELIIREGATLSFGSGQGIVADGTVSVSGTQASPVVLEASGARIGMGYTCMEVMAVSIMSVLMER